MDINWKLIQEKYPMIYKKFIYSFFDKSDEVSIEVYDYGFVNSYTSETIFFADICFCRIQDYFFYVHNVLFFIGIVYYDKKPKYQGQLSWKDYEWYFGNKPDISFAGIYDDYEYAKEQVIYKVFEIMEKISNEVN